MISIPPKESKKFSASSQGDLFGNLNRTRNLDFRKKGYTSLAKKPFVLYTQTQDADFQSPIAILSDDNCVYVITNDNAFRIVATSPIITVTEITTGAPPTFGFQSDAAFFTADLHASGTTMVCSYNLGANSWTSRITGLSASYPHPLCVSEHQQYLAVGNGNTVGLYDGSYSLITTLTIPAAHVVTWIRWRANLLFIGTRNILGGEARMFLWNGSGTAAQAGYAAGCEWLMSGCEYESSIAVVTSNGQLMKFLGDGFVPIRTDNGIEANFPIYNSGLPWGSAASTSNLVGKVASRGMIAKGRRLMLVVDGEITFTSGGTPGSMIDFPSGLWEFDPEVGLYHKAGLDHKQRASLQPTSVTADVILLPSAVVFETGDPVVIEAVVGFTGDITSEQIYYAIKVDSTHLKLANTPQQALAGLNITVTGTPSALDRLDFNVYQSVGATKIARAGGINLVTRLVMPRFQGGEVIYGGLVTNSVGTDVGAVMSLGMGKNVGSFITPKVQASNVTDLFKKLITKFPPLNIPSRKILLKYRILNRWGVPGRRDFRGGLATWINSTSFTVNPKLFDMYSAAVGDEVEFTSRAASGYTAHISLITVNSATDWTITIDEAMPDVTAADTSTFFFDNFTKYKTISTVADAKAAAKGFANHALTKNAKWVQFKVELRGYHDIDESMDMEELSVVNGADQKYA